MLNAFRHRRNTDIRAFLTVALAVAMAIRVLAAPAALAQAPEGSIAICSGGTVIYLSVDGDQPAERAASAEVCPIAGLASAVAPIEGDVALPPMVLLGEEIRLPDRGQFFIAAPTTRLGARAPPSFRDV
ncbi:MAG: hypothetical protein AAFQ73_06555 [Pseudomonadota bacterium]